MAIDGVVDQEGLKDVKVEEMCRMEYDRQPCSSSLKTMGTFEGNGESKAKKLVLRESLKKTTIEERKTKEATEPKLNSKLANKHDDKMDWHTNSEVKDSDADSKSDSISDSDSKSDSKSDNDSKSDDDSKSEDDSKSDSDSKSEDSKSDSSSKVGPKSGGKKNKRKKKSSQLKEEESSFKQDTSSRQDEHMEDTDKNKEASKEEKLPAFGKDAMEEGTRDIN